MKRPDSSVFTLMFIAGSCATGKKASVTERDIYKEPSGTWINKDYDGPPGGEPYAKIVFKRDGTLDFYADSSDASRIRWSEFITIEEKWVDSENNILFKVKVTNLLTNYQFFYSGKIHSSGTVWEFIYTMYDYHNEINPNHGQYRIYYRQELRDIPRISFASGKAAFCVCCQSMLQC